MGYPFVPTPLTSEARRVEPTAQVPRVEISSCTWMILPKKRSRLEGIRIPADCSSGYVLKPTHPLACWITRIRSSRLCSQLLRTRSASTSHRRTHCEFASNVHFGRQRVDKYSFSVLVDGHRKHDHPAVAAFAATVRGGHEQAQPHQQTPGIPGVCWNFISSGPTGLPPSVFDSG